jgi:S1-C subfamily serine protease
VALALAVVTITPGCAPNAEPSAMVGIVVDNSCDPGIETGSGVLVAPGLVLTSAHVVSGGNEIRVVRDEQSVAAEIVGFDPRMDLAYLAVDGLRGLPMSVSSKGVEAGDTGITYVLRDDAVVEVPVTVLRRVNISTENIYLEGETLRPGFELVADFQGGDSGGAIVIAGDVAAVVWARSRRFDGRSYAIDPDRGGELIREQLRTGKLGDDIDLARCP